MSSREVTREQYATAMLGLKNSANRARGVVSSEIDTLAWYVDAYVSSLEAARDKLKEYRDIHERLLNEALDEASPYFQCGGRYADWLVPGQCIFKGIGVLAGKYEAAIAERDELKKQLEGALAMYDIRLKKFDDLKARLDEEGFAGE